MRQLALPLPALSTSRSMLADTGLLDLPPAIGDFSALQVLNVSHNALRALPPELAGLAGSLRVLNLGDNQFRGVPPITSTLTALTSLLLNLCPVRDLPPRLEGMEALVWLDLSECQLTSLPSGLLPSCPSLTRLDLHSNKAGSEPAERAAGGTASMKVAGVLLHSVHSTVQSLARCACPLAPACRSQSSRPTCPPCNVWRTCRCTAARWSAWPRSLAPAPR